MADVGAGIGSFLQGFASTYFPAQQRAREFERQKRTEERLNKALGLRERSFDFQKEKAARTEERLDEALGLRERMFEFRQEQAQKMERLEQKKLRLNRADTFFKLFTDPNRTPEQKKRAFKFFLPSALGIDPKESNTQDKFNLLLDELVSGEEKTRDALANLLGGAIADEEKRNELVPLYKTLPVADLMSITKDVVKQKMAPPTFQSQTVVTDQGPRAGRFNPRTGVTEAQTETGFRPTKPGEFAGKAQGAPGEFGGLTKTQRGKSRLEAARNAAAISEIAGTLRKAKKLASGASGFRGKIAESLGGLAGQISEELGETVTESISGISEEQLTDMRLRLRTIAAQTIEQITGEGGSRVSEAERRLAERASRLATLEASPTQIQQALTTLMQLKVLQSERNRFETGKDFAFDAGAKTIRQFQSQLGLSEDQAIDLVVQMRRQREFLKNFGGR